ncbi:winged helix-turn-helix domain-containing protein [Tenacibaculum sp. HL-MS23]|uniref:winged helix-turn-helix domain-containing protein n=1 Tax=Tenacibaculum TaxID=104267 RepID=UPI002104D16D|nr:MULTISPECIES: winged helix-turn-helix domain-containing protein [Tenacibaculum]WNW02975.1 winged helix-turn-helix domain-containing protein [Tenacibaculum sp. HL-MS23]
MNKNKIYIYCGFAFFLLLGWFFSTTNSSKDFTERVKVSLRDVGNQLLLSDKDSTSLVLPIIELENNKYELSFQKKFSFEPDNLVTFINTSFSKVKLPNDYRVEVLRCLNSEVSYSYQNSALKKSTIIPCRERVLPKGCYVIQVVFFAYEISFWHSNFFLIGLLLLVIVFIIHILFSGKKEVVNTSENIKEYTKIGSFQFYPTQNKLVKKATEISLSKKECEILAIFVASPNQIIKREDLTKKVWEDNGVFVGRSLDTYISKLRKKLKEDSSIKLTNVHGVGYKLEVF